MKNRICALVLLFACLLWMPVGVTKVQAAGDVYIIDNADLCTDEEETALYNDMQGILPYGGAAFVTNSAEYDGEASYLAKEWCDYLYNGGSGVVFLIDMYNRRIEIYSTGEIYHVLGNSKATEITDLTYSYATDEEYYACAKEAFQKIQITLEGGKVVAPMKFVTNALMSFGVVFLIMYYVLYSNRALKKCSENSDALEGDEGNGDFVNVTKCVMTKQTKTTHSESSGGSGGGGGGGGGSSGGGGGHSF